MDQNVEDKINKNKERNMRLANAIIQFQKSIKPRNDNDDESILMGREEKDEYRRIAVNTRLYAEAIEMTIGRVVEKDIVKDLLKCFFDAFVESKREMDYKKIGEGFFSFSESDGGNIDRLILRYSHDSMGGGYCGYSAILGATGSKRFYEYEYNNFFYALGEYLQLVNSNMEIAPESWTEPAKYRKTIDKWISKVYELFANGFKFNPESGKIAYVRGFIAAVSNWAIKNKKEAQSCIGLLDTGSEALPEIIDISKKLFDGIKGLAEDYSALLHEGCEKYEDSDGMAINGAIEKDFSAVDLESIAKIHPVKINKCDLGLIPGDAPATGRRYAIQQSFCGHNLIMEVIEVKDDYGNEIPNNEIELDYDSLVFDVSTGDITWLPQSDDDLNKTVDITMKRKIYKKKEAEGVRNLKVKFKKKCEKDGKVCCPPAWIDPGRLIGFSKIINKPFFLLSNNRLSGQILFVYDASKIKEKGNRQHLCKFVFSDVEDLARMPDEDIEYYGKLALKYSSSISVGGSPVVFFSAGGESLEGHYTHLDPYDKKIRENFEKEIKGMFFDRYIKEAERRRRIKLIDWQATTIRDLKKQIKTMNETASKQQNDREQTLNKQEIRLEEKQNSIEKNTNNLEIKEKDLNKKEQNIQEKENKLQIEEKRLADKERELKERESLQNELEVLKKTSEKKVNGLNLEVQTLKSKNSEQKKQISILASKNNDQKLTQMQERITKITSDNEKKVKDLQSKNEKQETELESDKKLLDDKNKELTQMKKKVDELSSELANQKKEFEAQKQQLTERRGLESKFTNENNQLKEHAKTQEQQLSEYQTEIQKLKDWNEELKKRLELTDTLPGNKQLQQEQKEKEDVNEKKELRIRLIAAYLESIKISNTSTILYVFAWIFQWASDICKSYIEKATYEKKLVLSFEQLKRNLKANGGNIDNNNNLIGKILTNLDSFMLKYCDDDMREKLANLYSELLNFHQHDTENIIKAFRKISNGEKYIKLIRKNSIAKAYQQNIKESVINGGNNNLININKD